jgi:hypothetical protein
VDGFSEDVSVVAVLVNATLRLEAVPSNKTTRILAILIMGSVLALAPVRLILFPEALLNL